MRTHLLVVALALGACNSPSKDVAVDNTATNNRDHTLAPTADKAGNSDSDLEVTQKIRKAVMADGTLSTYAHNCKIVVKDGVVTLVGPVRTDQESTRVSAIAGSLVGEKRVINQLEVTN